MCDSNLGGQSDSNEPPQVMTSIGRREEGSQKKSRVVQPTDCAKPYACEGIEQLTRLLCHCQGLKTEPAKRPGRRQKTQGANPRSVIMPPRDAAQIKGLFRSGVSHHLSHAAEPSL